jgi:hypothetical protein
MPEFPARAPAEDGGPEQIMAAKMRRRKGKGGKAHATGKRRYHDNLRKKRRMAAAMRKSKRELP